MFEIIEKGNTVFYINNKHKLKLKAEKIDDSYHVYINLNGYNPVFSMLIYWRFIKRRFRRFVP